MKVVMTPQELRDYIRSMPDDEMVSITIADTAAEQDRDDRER